MLQVQRLRIVDGRENSCTFQPGQELRALIIRFGQDRNWAQALT